MSAKGSCPRGLGAVIAFTFCATLVVAQTVYADYRAPERRIDSGVTSGGYIPFGAMKNQDGSPIGGFGSYYMRWYPNGPIDTNGGVTCAAGTSFGGGDLNFYLGEGGPCNGLTNTGHVEHFEMGDSQYWEAVEGTIGGNDWKRTSFGPLPCTQDCNDNVLFIPGIESSRLYRPDYNGGTNQLWEPDNDSDANDLGLDEAGHSVRSDIYTKDVIDEAYLPAAGPNVYKSFLADLDDLKFGGKINDWSSAPYDWRVTLEDILSYGNNIDGRIYYSGDLRATSSPFIIEKLKHLAETSKTKKVTIIAHSNGGLVTKALTLKLGEDASKYIDRIIFVAVPQLGAPAAIAALLHGRGQNIPFHLSRRAVRDFAVNSPGTYNLLPSANYFSTTIDPVISIDFSTIPEWTSKYGHSISSQETLHNFLIDSFSTERSASQSEDVTTPGRLNSTLLSQAEFTHEPLDTWSPPVGIETISIAGWGVETLAGLNYRKVPTCTLLYQAGLCAKYENKLTIDPQLVIDGDGTVVESSALWSQYSSTAKYWANILEFNKENPLSASLTGRSHKDVLEIPSVREFLVQSISTSTNNELPNYISSSRPIYTGDSPRIHLTMHSPVSLDYYDLLGRHTGYSTSTNNPELNIPGVQYEKIGEIQWLSIPTGLPGKVVMSGQSKGSFTLDLVEVNGNHTVASSTFQSIPATESTRAEISIDSVSPITSSGTLRVDENDDGIIDFSLKSSPNTLITIPRPIIGIRPTDQIISLSSPMPTFSSTLSGFLDADTASSSTTGEAICISTATSTAIIGTYPITCTKGSLVSSIYQFAPIATGTLNIIYRWDGFLQPINDTAHQQGQSLSVFKAGSTVPVKFQLKKDDGTPTAAPVSPAWLKPVRGNPMNATIDETSYTDTGTTGSSYKWDASSQQYIYNWSTKGLGTGYWYRVYAQLNDGSTYSVVVGLK